MITKIVEGLKTDSIAKQKWRRDNNKTKAKPSLTYRHLCIL